MERSLVTDNYDKAKIEVPNPILPEFLQRISSDISPEYLPYKKVFASQAPLKEQADRKVYRIRNEDLFATFGENCEHMKGIHSISKATISVFANEESKSQCHTYIEMVGTTVQVRTAENLILKEILPKYDCKVFPVILMPPIIHEEHVTIPLSKVESFIGPNNSNLIKLEMESRTWMMIDRGPPSSSELDGVVKVYGPQENVINAMSLVQSEIHKPGKSSEAEKETKELFKKVQCVEKNDCKNSEGTSEAEKGNKQIQADEVAKANVEDPTQLLPKSLLELNENQATRKIYYWKSFEDDYKTTKHLAEALAAGEQTARKIHRICDKEGCPGFRYFLSMESLDWDKCPAIYDLPPLEFSQVTGLKDWNYFSKRPFDIFWDIENCNIPAKEAPNVSTNIKAYLNRKFGIEEKFIRIYAYADFSKMCHVKSRLKGVEVKDRPKTRGRKDVADKALIYDLGKHANKYSGPVSIMLISGDVDFSYPLLDLHDMGHNIILAIPSGSWVWFDLTNAADHLLYWPNVFRGEDQSNLSLQIQKYQMLVEEKQTVDSVRVQVKPQLHHLSLNEATPIQPGDLMPGLVELQKVSSKNRTLLALLRNSSKS